MKTEKCEWCREDIEIGWGSRRRGSLFCNDKCRTSYHNARKKLEKLRFAMHDNLDFFRSMMHKGGELPQVAAEAIFVIAKDANVHQMKFSCKACGQQRMDFPRLFDRCSFCDKNEWKFELRGENHEQI